MVYAIAQHALMTGSLDYIRDYGLELMIAVCRFWSQRVSYSTQRHQYVILGVSEESVFESLAKPCFRFFGRFFPSE